MHKMNTSASSRRNIKVVHLENFQNWFLRKMGVAVCALQTIAPAWESQSFPCSQHHSLFAYVSLKAHKYPICADRYSIWQVHKGQPILAFELRSFKVILGQLDDFLLYHLSAFSQSHLLPPVPSIFHTWFCCCINPNS